MGKQNGITGSFGKAQGTCDAERAHLRITELSERHSPGVSNTSVHSCAFSPSLPCSSASPPFPLFFRSSQRLRASLLPTGSRRMCCRESRSWETESHNQGHKGC